MRMDYWDDDWEYDLELWVSTEKPFDQVVEILRRAIEPVEIIEGVFELGGIRCEVCVPTRAPVAFPEIPQETYSVVIRIPVCTQMPWCFIDKSFAIAIALSLKHAVRCRVLVTADNDFFVGLIGTGLPLHMNERYRPWHTELRNFLDGQEYLALSL